MNARSGQARKLAEEDPVSGETNLHVVTRLASLEEQLAKLARAEKHVVRELDNKGSVEMLRKVETSTNLLTNTQIQSSMAVEGLNMRVSLHSKRHGDLRDSQQAISSHQKALSEGLSQVRVQTDVSEEKRMIQERWNIDATEAISELRKEVQEMKS